MKLILASKSRYRKEVLEKDGLIFDVVLSDIEEYSTKVRQKKYVMDLSKQSDFK